MSWRNEFDRFTSEMKLKNVLIVVKDFEESDIEGFVEKLENYYPEVKYVNRLMTHSWGQKVIRFYDPDGNLIEVGTPV